MADTTLVDTTHAIKTLRIPNPEKDGGYSDYNFNATYVDGLDAKNTIMEVKHNGDDSNCEVVSVTTTGHKVSIGENPKVVNAVSGKDQDSTEEITDPVVKVAHSGHSVVITSNKNVVNAITTDDEVVSVNRDTTDSHKIIISPNEDIVNKIESKNTSLLTISKNTDNSHQVDITPNENIITGAAINPTEIDTGILKIDRNSANKNQLDFSVNKNIVTTVVGGTDGNGIVAIQDEHSLTLSPGKNIPTSAVSSDGSISAEIKDNKISIAVSPTYSSKLTNKLDTKPNGRDALIVDGKISDKYLSDTLLGQLAFGGTLGNITRHTESAIAGFTPSESIAKKLADSVGENYTNYELSYTTIEIAYSYLESKISTDIVLYYREYEDEEAMQTYEGNATITVPEGWFFIAGGSGEIPVDKPVSQIMDVEVGDWLLKCDDVWTKIDNTDAVRTVNGQIGDVSITAENLPGIENIDTDTTYTFDDSNPGKVIVTAHNKSGVAIGTQEFSVGTGTGEAVAIGTLTTTDIDNIWKIAFGSSIPS